MRWRHLGMHCDVIHAAPGMRAAMQACRSARASAGPCRAHRPPWRMRFQSRGWTCRPRAVLDESQKGRASKLIRQLFWKQGTAQKNANLKGNQVATRIQHGNGKRLLPVPCAQLQLSLKTKTFIAKMRGSSARSPIGNKIMKKYSEPHHFVHNVRSRDAR